MKINEILAAKSAVYLSAISIVLMLATAGCNSLLNIKPRPELSVRDYTKQEKLWNHMLRDTYSNWKSPDILLYPIDNATSANSSGNKSGRNHKNKPSSGKLSPKTSRQTKYLPPQPQVNEETRRHLIEAQSSADASELSHLPKAILDIDPVRPSPPSSQQDYKIVPDTHDSGNHRMTTATRPKSGYSYRVKKGETLYKIARKLYGYESAWKLIFMANKAIIKDPNNIKPGIFITIP